MLRGRRAFASLAQKRAFSVESFLTGNNSAYLETMYDSYKMDPQGVHVSWRAYFDNIEQGVKDPFQPPPFVDSNVEGSATSEMLSIRDTIKVYTMARAYQIRGHQIAKIDPLELHTSAHARVDLTNVDQIPEGLDPAYFGFTSQDLEREFQLGTEFFSGVLSGASSTGGLWKLKDLLKKLQDIYTEYCGFEYMHLNSRTEKNWLRERIENQRPLQYTAEQQIAVYEQIARATLLEEFLHMKFQTHKRFGMDGLEGMVPGMNALIEASVANGVETFVICTAHRGRLNMLANVLDFPLDIMFGQFLGSAPKIAEGGDVKYHLGTECIREINGKKVNLILLPNPSHLETVDPVCMGHVRAQQMMKQDPMKVLGIMIHGDAALAGQGIVYETTQMQDLFEYKTFGTIHLVANNNIGFTTTPREARSGLHPTEVAKTVLAPVVHVNADQPEEVDWVCRLAADYRAEFKKDIFVDIVGYRRHGHNELDEPLFTNPLMYKIIRGKQKAFNEYGDKLKGMGIMKEPDILAITQKIRQHFDKNYGDAKRYQEGEVADEFKMKEWSKLDIPSGDVYDTSVPQGTLVALGKRAYEIPEDLNLHPLVAKTYATRIESLEKGEGIDFANAEALAFASLLSRGNHVRISGQDVERGTFSQRHAIIFDQQVDKKKFVPLQQVCAPETEFVATNSLLSEYAVLGYEYGYALSNPNSLVIWEAQFGDFANGAQILIDCFLVSGESKWGTESSLVMLLPHGLDGQGPEHSSCRLERFLQLSSEDATRITDQDQENREHTNIQVCVPTTPANLFHMLRRQVRRDFRKPLIIASPKKMLRHKLAVSDISEFSEPGGRVLRTIDETDERITDNPEKVKKVIFCSGQVYYDLFEKREALWAEKDMGDIAILRMEQITPFPFDKVEEAVEEYPNAEFQWVQEEHQNSGAWIFVEPRFNLIMEKYEKEDMSLISRPPSASSATGYAQVHKQEIADVLAAALSS